MGHARQPSGCQHTVLNISPDPAYPEVWSRFDLHTTTGLISLFFPFAGDFSLDIFPVMLDDDARYQCQVSPGSGGQPGIRSKFATLTVLVPPEPPRIVQGDFLVTTEDREIELECVSLAGKPAAEVRTVATGLTATTVLYTSGPRDNFGPRLFPKYPVQTLKHMTLAHYFNITF